MRVAVVGAGLAGLGAARELAKAEHQVTVYEKSDALGGRLLTKRLGDYVFDAGATSIAPMTQPT